jgi:hypothetical protein
MPFSIALATWEEFPDLSEDDRLLQHELHRRGHAARAARWDDPAVDWGAFDAIVIRSTWDYTWRLREFLEWVRRGARLSALFNDRSTIEGNWHKSYLRRLAEAGAPVVPTEFGRIGESLTELCERTGWDSVVVKPAVSASARGAYLVAPPERAAFEPRYRDALSAGEQMVQPFLPGVLDPGERSLVFFDGKLSHAFQKGPALPVDRRDEFGYRPVPASEDERRVAERIVSGLDRTPLYARVDLVPGPKGLPLLMELELIEPYLGLSTSPGAESRLADALERRLTPR